MEARSAALRSAWMTLVALLFAVAAVLSAIWGMDGLGTSVGDIDREKFGEASDWALGSLGTVSLIVGGLQLLTGFVLWQGVQARAAWIAGLILAIAALLLDLSLHHTLNGWAIGGLAVNLAIVVILAARESDFR